MKKLLPLMLLVAVCVALTLGQTNNCPAPTSYPLSGYDTPVDPNRVQWDYVPDPNNTDPNAAAPMQFLMRPPIRTILGGTVTVDGWVCDPDGDDMVVSATAGQLTPSVRDGQGTWTWSYKPIKLGIEYVYVTVTDVRPGTNDQKTRTGTLIVETIAPNQRPGMGCAVLK